MRYGSEVARINGNCSFVFCHGVNKTEQDRELADTPMFALLFSQSAIYYSFCFQVNYAVYHILYMYTFDRKFIKLLDLFFFFIFAS